MQGAGQMQELNEGQLPENGSLCPDDQILSARDLWKSQAGVT